MKLQQRRAAKFKPDDHSEVVPLLPIPNRTVKHLSADDSGCTSVKVGHRQALTPQTPAGYQLAGVCLLCGNIISLVNEALVTIRLFF